MARRGEKYWETTFDSRDSFRERQKNSQRSYVPPPLPPPPSPVLPPAVPAQRVPPRRRAAGGPCEGPCNSRWRRAQEVLDAFEEALRAWEADPAGNPPAEPEVPEASPWPGDPVLCPRCQADTRSLISQISDLAAQAQAEVSGHRHGPGGDRVSGSRGSPSPSPVHDILDQLAYELRSWQSVALDQDETPPRMGDLLPEIAMLCARLSAIHFAKLTSSLDYGAEFAAEMRGWYRRLKNLTTAGTGRHPLPVPCHRCGSRSLEVEDGATYVECTHRDQDGARCGLLLSRSEYESEAAAWLARRRPAKLPAA